MDLINRLDSFRIRDDSRCSMFPEVDTDNKGFLMKPPLRSTKRSADGPSLSAMSQATALDRLYRLVDEENFTLQTWRESDGSLWASVMPGEGHARSARRFRLLLPSRTRFGPLSEWMPMASGERLVEVLGKLEAILGDLDSDLLNRDSEWTKAVIDAVRIAMNANHDENLRIVGQPRR